jgi:hypothetical protein
VWEELAYYEENTRDFLFPEPKLTPSHPGKHREVLMKTAKSFPVSDPAHLSRAFGEKFGGHEHVIPDRVGSRTQSFILLIAQGILFSIPLQMPRSRNQIVPISTVDLRGRSLNT